MDALWIALGAAFLVIEGWALARTDDDLDPLTFHVRRFIRHPAGLAAFGAFYVWLGAHFFLGV